MDNERLTEKSAISSKLLRLRAPIWTSSPFPPNDASDAILDAYFTDECRSTLNDNPHPQLGKIAGLILSPGNSAPGLDGIPYEFSNLGSFLPHTCSLRPFTVLDSPWTPSCWS